MTAELYVRALLEELRRLPGTSGRTGPGDRRLARELHDHGVPLDLIRAALLLATVRRLVATDGSIERLEPVRSLAYFRHTIEEIRRAPLPPDYLQHLRRLICRIVPQPGS